MQYSETFDDRVLAFLDMLARMSDPCSEPPLEVPRHRPAPAHAGLTIRQRPFGKPMVPPPLPRRQRTCS